MGLLKTNGYSNSQNQYRFSNFKRLNWLFQVLEIEFQALEIQFQALEILIKLKIIFWVNKISIKLI